MVTDAVPLGLEESPSYPLYQTSDQSHEASFSCFVLKVISIDFQWKILKWETWSSNWEMETDNDTLRPNRSKRDYKESNFLWNKLKLRIQLEESNNDNNKSKDLIRNFLGWLQNPFLPFNPAKGPSPF